MNSLVIGIDEVGRGPLAGPVMVGVAAVPVDFDWAQLLGVTDSKKLTEKKREQIFETAVALHKEAKLFFAVAEESAAVIDTEGIVPAINKALSAALNAVMVQLGAYVVARPREILGLAEECLVKLDGGLRAPAEFVHQETIIKGDAKEPVIGLASIMAKVTRDREMVRLAEAYPGYRLDVHKGYGTVAHREAVRHLGLSPIHRASFCKNCL